MSQTLARDLTTLVFGVPVLFELIVGALAVAMIRARNQRTLGALLAEERPGGRVRRAGASLVLLGLFGVLLVAQPGGRVLEFSGLLLVPALALVWLGPGFQDALLGEQGVQRGWQSRRFEELEEWRLSGGHLRFRLQGEWTSVPCPPERQPELRERLLRLNPARESAFRD
jgi:hypothetical protein